MGFMQKKEDKFYAAWKTGEGRPKDGKWSVAAELHWSIAARRLAVKGAERAGDKEAVEEISRSFEERW